MWVYGGLESFVQRRCESEFLTMSGCWLLGDLWECVGMCSACVVQILRTYHSAGWNVQWCVDGGVSVWLVGHVLSDVFGDEMFIVK